MGYTITINSENKQALALIEIAKSFEFVEIKKTTKPKKSTLKKKEELTIEDANIIAELSKKTKKGLAQKWENYFKNTEE